MSNYLNLSFFKVLILIYSFLISSVFADDIRIKINSGQVEPLPIAIADFTGEEGKANQIGRQIAEVISNNLVGSGQFKAVESAAFIAPPTSPSVRPNFTDWTPLGIKALITGSVKSINEQQIEVEFRLWDIIAENKKTGKKIFVDYPVLQYVKVGELNLVLKRKKVDTPSKLSANFQNDTLNVCNSVLTTLCNCEKIKF